MKVFRVVRAEQGHKSAGDTQFIRMQHGSKYKCTELKRMTTLQMRVHNSV